MPGKDANEKIIEIIKALDKLGYDIVEVKPEYAEGAIGTTGAILLKIVPMDAS